MNSEQDVGTKERLLMSGATLFAEKGFAGVSVRQICLHANTSANMIHHFYNSKDGLLKAIIEQFGIGVFSVPLKILCKTPNSREAFAIQMSLLFETTLEAYIEYRPLLMVAIREQANPEGLIHYSEAFIKFIEQAKTLGYVRKELDSAMITGFLLDRILNQVQFAPWMKNQNGQDVMNDADYRQQWCEANLDLFMNGFQTNPAL